MADQQSNSTQASTCSNAASTEAASSNFSATGSLQMASHTIAEGENYNNIHTILPGINFNINEDAFDEDDFDEEFSDGFDEDDEDMTDQTTESSDMTKQLLDFAENVNSDIQKYFGRKKDEDSCDIYEDKWISKKSGRELYLADILRIANGGDSSEDTKKTSRKEVELRKNGTLGKVSKSAGLGPLDELFRDIPKDLKDTVHKGKRAKRLQGSNGKGTSLLDRKLPSSFWIEPSVRRNNTDEQKSIESSKSTIATSQGKTSHAPATPDFSDLLESWTREESSSVVTATQATMTTVSSAQNSSG